MFNEHEKDTKEAHIGGMSGIEGRNLFQDYGTTLTRDKKKVWQGEPLITEFPSGSINTPSEG